MAAKPNTDVVPEETKIDHVGTTNPTYQKALDSPSHTSVDHTPEKIGAHVHEGWLVYRNPIDTMHWHMVAPDGIERLGVATNQGEAHKIITEYNLRSEIYGKLMKAERDRKQTNVEA